MAQFLKNLFLFLLCSIVGYIIILVFTALVLPPFLRKNLPYFEKASGFTCERMQESSILKDKEILFLGSSRAYRGFDPRIFKKRNFSSFNLGSSNQTPVQSLLILKRYLQNHKPKLIIFEVNPDIFSNDGVESAVDIISHVDFDFDMVEMAIKLNHIKVYNILILKSLLNLIGIDKRCPESALPNEKYIEGGYVEILSKSIEKMNTSYKCLLNPIQVSAFEEIVSLIKSNNIEYLLIQSPIQPITYHNCEINEGFSALMRTYGDYTDFNEIIKLNNDSDYSDDQHLSQAGIEKFNNLLIEKLVNLPK